MSIKRLSIPLSNEQHKLIKLSAIASGLSIKEYVLSRLLKQKTPSSVKVPNETTLKAMQDVEQRKNLKTYESAEEMLEDLGL